MIGKGMQLSFAIPNFFLIFFDFIFILFLGSDKVLGVWELWCGLI